MPIAHMCVERDAGARASAGVHRPKVCYKREGQRERKTYASLLLVLDALNLQDGVALADGVQATAVADKDGVGVEPGKK